MSRGEVVGEGGLRGGACLLIWRAFPIIQLVRNVGQRPWCSSCSPSLDSKCPPLTLYLSLSFSPAKIYIEIHEQK